MITMTVKIEIDNRFPSSLFNVSITVYKIDHVHRRLTPECSDANTCRAAKTQDKCKIINRHTHTHTHTHTAECSPVPPAATGVTVEMAFDVENLPTVPTDSLFCGTGSNPLSQSQRLRL